jgi:DNA invertase Pin-like site-specific DNA recombinase
MRKVINYVRISTKEQNNSLQIQEIPNSILIDDVVSGGVLFSERPGAKKVIQWVLNGEVSEVHVNDITRLGRNTIDILNTIQFFTYNGVNLISKREGIQTLIDGKPNMITQLIVGIMSTLAEFERENLSIRRSEGIKKAKERGAYVNNQRPKETIEDFINKPASIQILKHLKKKQSIRWTATKTKYSINTVSKVYKVAIELKLL